MGRVYAARDTELGREVALKVASLDSPDAQARLRREAQHASRLSHPHICHIYDVGRDDGQLFIVMELVHGRSLADVIREGPLSIADASRYGSEIADALAHAHERGVTHRDLKSTNVMITARGAKVLDFGLARILDTHQIDALSHSQRSLTAEGMIAGTLPYMAPELLRGERGDQRADIWALGVLLYEMVGGRRPFTGGTGFELSAAILHQPAEPLPPAVPAPMADDHSAVSGERPWRSLSTGGGRAPRAGGDEGCERHHAHAMFRPSRGVSRWAPVVVLLGLAIAAVVSSRIGSRIEIGIQQPARGIHCCRPASSSRRSNSFRAWPIASPPRRIPGTASARGTWRAACPTSRSMRTRGHSPSSRRSSRPFSAGDSRWRRWAGTRKRWRTAVAGLQSPGVSVVAGRSLRGRGKGSEEGQRDAKQDDDAEATASALADLIVAVDRARTICTRAGGTPRRRDCARAARANQPSSGARRPRRGRRRASRREPDERRRPAWFTEVTARQRRPRRIELGRGARRRDCARARSTRSRDGEFQGVRNRARGSRSGAASWPCLP